MTSIGIHKIKAKLLLQTEQWFQKEYLQRQ